MHMADYHCTAETDTTLQFTSCISMKKLLIRMKKKKKTNKREIEDRKTQRLPEGSGQ